MFVCLCLPLFVCCVISKFVLDITVARYRGYRDRVLAYNSKAASTFRKCQTSFCFPEYFPGYFAGDFLGDARHLHWREYDSRRE